MNGLVLAGAVSGVLLGAMLRHSDLCFHSMIRGLLFERRTHLAAIWAVGVSVAAVGLSVIYGVGDWDLNQGLGFEPVANIAGGLLIGIGMVVALSCASGLFYKLGAGMLGALVGIVGWTLGELVVRDLDVPGPGVYTGGDDATLPGVIGVPRIVVALALLAGVVALLWRHLGADPARGWVVAGCLLGVVTTIAWALAGSSGADFGPSTVGAPTAAHDALRGEPLADQATWLLAFLAGVIGGSAAWSLRSGRLWVRGEDLTRFGGLAVGGALLGAGGRIADGCNLGHGLSGVAQMNMSSYVVAASICAGVWLAVTFKSRMITSAPRTRDHWQADATVDAEPTASPR